MGALQQALLGYPPPSGGGDFITTNVFNRVRASDVGGLNNGDPMTNWIDSINGYTWVPTNNPTWRSADGPNSKPCVRFAGASQQYFTGPDWSGLGLTQVESWVIVKVNNDPPASLALSGIWSLNNVGSDVFRLCLFPFTDGKVYETAFTVGVRTENDFATTLAQWNAYAVRNDGTGSGFNNFLNGTAGSTPQTNGIVNPATTYLGRSAVTGLNAYLDGDIAEWWCVSASTAGAQRTSMNDYCLSEYGITVI